MCIDIKNLVSWAQIIAVLVAIAALIYQIVRSRFSLSIDLVLKLESQFNNGSFKRLRAGAAKAALANELTPAEDVFDFFETIGLLLRRKAVNEEFAWHTFFHWVHGYWTVGNEYIANKRRKRDSLWKDFLQLHQRLVEVEKRKEHLTDSDLVLSNDEIREFLEQERDLLDSTTEAPQ